MKKDVYVAPVMEIYHLELEHGFMKASIFEPETGHHSGVTIDGHEVASEFDYSNDPEIGGNNTWD